MTTFLGLTGRTRIRAVDHHVANPATRKGNTMATKRVKLNANVKTARAIGTAAARYLNHADAAVNEKANPTGKRAQAALANLHDVIRAAEFVAEEG